jgi:hypothetical protein
MMASGTKHDPWILKTPPGTVEAWGRSPDNPVDGWYGLHGGYRDGPNPSDATVIGSYRLLPE